MIEVLQFIFSSFWIWLGSFMLLGVITQAVVALVALLVGAHR